MSPELAGAADVLSDQLREQLQRLATSLEPHLEKLDRRFAGVLKKQGLTARQCASLLEISPGAAARVLVSGRPAIQFLEQVEYQGRRLAKLNLTPSAVMAALEQYDILLGKVLSSGDDASNLAWAREQLSFCIVLSLNNAYYQVREWEAKAFYDLARIELESKSLAELLRRGVESLVQTYRADAGRLYLINEDRSAWGLKAASPWHDTFAAHNRPALAKVLANPAYLDHRRKDYILDPSWRKSGHCVWSIPLKLDGSDKAAGVLQLGFKREHEWLPREIEFLTAAAERCMIAADKQRLAEDLVQREEQVRKLAEHMLHVEEVERQRISRELHDEAGQSLLCIRLQMEMIEQALPAAAEESRAQLSEARSLTERTILEMRRLISALSPAVLEQLGLSAALRQLISRFRRLYPCQVKLKVPRLREIPHQLEIISYRLVQECLNNIGKHSAAKNVNISVTSTDGRLRLNVEDDGVGFDVGTALTKRESFGLAGMRERVALLSGHFHVESRLKGRRTGTKIWVELPITS